MTIPAEYSHKDKQIMRECAFAAKLIGTPDTEALQFTAERRIIYYFFIYLDLSS